MAKFADIAVGMEEIETQGVELVEAEGDSECEICDALTPWIHYEDSVNICSDECLTEYLRRQEVITARRYMGT